MLEQPYSAQAREAAASAAKALEPLMPVTLQQEGPLGLQLWQWVALPCLLALAALAGLLLARLTTTVALKLATRSATAWDDQLFARLSAPLRLLYAAGASWAAEPLLGLPPQADAALVTCARVALYLAVFWALFRAVAVTAAHVSGSPWAVQRPGSRALVSLGARLARIALMAAAAVSLLSGLGYPVASLVAGLGIGGLAVALGAQKTLENLFGAFALAVDQPFREGDFVKVEDFVGTVESIGMRSTRIRTLDRTVISIPNGKLADARLETFAARDRIRLACTVRLVYGTTAKQLREVLAGLEAVLRGQPKIWPDAVVVRFKELAAESLDVEVMAWFQTADYGGFQAIRQDVLLGFIEVVECAGTSFAFPTRTVHVVGPAPAPRERPEAGQPLEERR